MVYVMLVVYFPEDIENKMVKCGSELALDKHLNNFNSLTWGENILDH